MRRATLESLFDDSTNELRAGETLVKEAFEKLQTANYDEEHQVGKIWYGECYSTG